MLFLLEGRLSIPRARSLRTLEPAPTFRGRTDRSSHRPPTRQVETPHSREPHQRPAKTQKRPFCRRLVELGADVDVRKAVVVALFVAPAAAVVRLTALVRRLVAALTSPLRR